MRSAWQAARIMWILNSSNTSTLKATSTVTVNIGTIIFYTDVYEPKGTYKGTIAVVHGMSPHGKNDPRMEILCHALSRVGFRVVSPEIPSIQELKIDSAQVQIIADILDTLASTTNLTPSGRLSVLAPSFSGAMCLAAAAMPEVKNKIISICAIGAFSEVESVIRFLLTDASADTYGLYIMLKKILPLALKNHRSIQQALDAAIQDNINQSVNTELHKCLAKMNPSERQSVSRLFTDLAYRQQIFQTSRADIDREIKALDIVSHLDALTASVFLLHGKNDNVIPCAQSEILYARLKELKKKAGLVVTPLLSHGDTQFSIKRIPDLVRIIRGFAGFFHDLKHAH